MRLRLRSPLDTVISVLYCQVLGQSRAPKSKVQHPINKGSNMRPDSHHAQVEHEQPTHARCLCSLWHPPPSNLVLRPVDMRCFHWSSAHRSQPPPQLLFLFCSGHPRRPSSIPPLHLRAAADDHKDVPRHEASQLTNSRPPSLTRNPAPHRCGPWMPCSRSAASWPHREGHLRAYLRAPPLVQGLLQVISLRFLRTRTLVSPKGAVVVCTDHQRDG